MNKYEIATVNDYGLAFINNDTNDAFYFGRFDDEDRTRAALNTVIDEVTEDSSFEVATVGKNGLALLNRVDDMVFLGRFNDVGAVQSAISKLIEKLTEEE